MHAYAYIIGQCVLLDDILINELIYCWESSANEGSLKWMSGLCVFYVSVVICLNTASIINKFLVRLFFPFLFTPNYYLAWILDCENKWLVKLKAETLKELFQHTHPSLSHFFPQTITKKSFSPPTLIQWPGNAGCVSPCVSLHSCVCLSCYALRQPPPYTTHVSNPTPNIHSVFTSVWHRWHSHGQLMFERVRLMRGSACSSLILLSMHSLFFPISVRCAMSSDCCPVFGFAEFLIWLF